MRVTKKAVSGYEVTLVLNQQEAEVLQRILGLVDTDEPVSGQLYDRLNRLDVEESLDLRLSGQLQVVREED